MITLSSTDPDFSTQEGVDGGDGRDIRHMFPGDSNRFHSMLRRYMSREIWKMSYISKKLQGSYCRRWRTGEWIIVSRI